MTVLGANPDTPSLYFGEAIGASVVSLEQITLRYNNLNVSGLPFVPPMNISIGGSIVATVNITSDYLGSPFAVEYRGTTYCGSFNRGTVSF